MQKPTNKNSDTQTAQMFCKYCGKQIPSDSTFCKYCGGQLVKPTTSDVAQTQSTEQSTSNEPQTAQQQQATQTMHSSSKSADLNKNENHQGYGGLVFILIALVILATLFCFNYCANTYISSQRTYIENTYEAFAAASVGDWYIDIHDGNKPKQVTQADIYWAQEQLRNRKSK